MPTPTFEDMQGREWEVAVNFDTLDRIAEETKLSFGNLQKLPEIWAKLLLEDVLAIDVIWLSLVREDDQLTKKDWLKNMDGKALAKALDAFEAAFCLHVGTAKAKVVTKTLAKIRKGFDQAINKALANIDKVKLP
jgi:hypothetical protein